jgi:glycerol-3-phosphate acyltransferase PlsY
MPRAESRPKALAGGALVVGFAYFAGALPLSNFAARRLRRVDLRDVGSGTVSGTSLYRVAGFAPLAAVGVLEVAKGTLGPLAAGRSRPALAAIAGGAAVAGHNWSPFLGGAGGRGLSPALGALLVQDPAGTAVLLGGMVAGRLAGETALGCLVAYAALVPVLAARRGRRGALAGAAVLAPMLLKRLTGNAPAPSRRAYLARLLVDRDHLGRAEAG